MYIVLHMYQTQCDYLLLAMGDPQIKGGFTLCLLTTLLVGFLVEERLPKPCNHKIYAQNGFEHFCV